MDSCRDVEFGELDAEMETRSDGTMIVRARQTLRDVPLRLTDRLDHWARTTPNATWLAQRDADGDWRRITYAQGREQARRIATALLARGLGPERPLAILSGNDIEQALLLLGAMYAGAPVAPISPAYSLISTDFEKLRDILARLTPGLVYASSAKAFSRAISACVGPDVEVATLSGALDRPTTPFADLVAACDERAVDAAQAATGPDTIAKILFTSGSTGRPKGVINTQRMICANQAMIGHWLAFGKSEPPVLVDWLPWHHTFGGNHNFGYVLNNGGALYIDGGKPTRQGVAETVRNLREISPTAYFNVPKGYEELAPYLRDDARLRATFFARLRMTFYAGASLPAHVAAEIDAVARQATGARILMVSSLGSTETAPAALACTKTHAQPGNVGVPLPGVELKLVPSGDKLEARVRAPSVMPAYWRDAEQSAAAKDEEGFYKLGDALRFAREGDANGGFLFDGRISEDFKLATGTWVSVGPLRTRLIAACAPLVKDAVVAGHDRDEVAALLVPEPDACRALGDGPTLRAALRERLIELAGGATGSSNRVTRAILLEEPLSIDANEITDKGSINQRAVLARRAALVEALYAAAPPDAVIRI